MDLHTACRVRVTIHHNGSVVFTGLSSIAPQGQFWLITEKGFGSIANVDEFKFQNIGDKIENGKERTLAVTVFDNIHKRLLNAVGSVPDINRSAKEFRN